MTNIVIFLAGGMGVTDMVWFQLSNSLAFLMNAYLSVLTLTKLHPDRNEMLHVKKMFFNVIVLSDGDCVCYIIIFFTNNLQVCHLHSDNVKL